MKTYLPQALRGGLGRWLPLLALALVLGSCGTAPVAESGNPLRVEIIDRWFVLLRPPGKGVDGRVLARDEFIFQMRGQCRQAKAEGHPPPAVELMWNDVGYQRIGKDLMNQLLLAGVTSVTLGS